MSLKTEQKREKTVINGRKAIRLSPCIPTFIRPNMHDPLKETDYLPPQVEIGTVVIHKTLGEGKIVWINCKNNDLHISFNAVDEKVFNYVTSFKDGLLTVKV